MDSLRSLASPSAQVIRGGKSMAVPSPQVVVGDIVELKTGGSRVRPCSPAKLTILSVVGDVVPADLRLVEAMNFETDEALLTGESLPVAKDINATWNTKESDFDPRDVGVGGELDLSISSNRSS